MRDSLTCLILPLREKNIILPSAAIVEILQYEKPKVILDMPDWLMGVLSWRGINIPLVDFETVNSHLVWNQKNLEEKESEIKGLYMAVINRINRPIANDTIQEKYPFISIILKGIPKICRISNETLKKVAGEQGDIHYLMEVKVQNSFVFIPNLNQMWRIIDDLPPRLQWFRQIML